MNKVTLWSLLSLTTIISACANVNVSTEQNVSQPQLQDEMKDNRENFSSFHSHIQVSEYAERLANDLVKGLANETINSPIAIVAFVEHDETLQKTNTLGRLLSENLVTEMGVFGIPIMDLHLLNIFISDDKDEFVFSRDPSEFYHDNELNYVLSGVMIKSERGVIVNARIMEFSSQRVLSTARVLIPPYVLN